MASRNLSKALSLVAIALDGGTVQYQWLAADLPAFEAGSIAGGDAPDCRRDHVERRALPFDRALQGVVEKAHDRLLQVKHENPPRPLFAGEGWGEGPSRA